MFLFVLLYSGLVGIWMTDYSYIQILACCLIAEWSTIQMVIWIGVILNDSDAIWILD